MQFRLPLKPNLHINEFSGGGVVEAETYAINTIYDQYDDGRWYATQRPGINIFEDASSEVGDARGRGVYWWDSLATPTSYIVNNSKVYAGSYAGSSMNISAGTCRVEMFEVGEYLVILDAENDEGWVIHDATPTVIAAISFPAALTNLARGGVVLNGKAFVADHDTGDIFESDIEDPTTWGALNFRQAELEPDDAIYVAKHHENVVVLGARTTEFFYDNANPTGSTLNPRTDVSYETGTVDFDSIWEESDVIFFVGQTESGGIGVYMIDGFQLSKISTSTIDTFLTSALTTDGINLVGSGFQSGGRMFYVLTLYNKPTDIEPITTLVLSAGKSIWGFWELAHTGLDDFPLVAWTPSTTTRAGTGILSNGDLITVGDDFNPQDTTNASSVFEDGVFEVGVWSATGAAGEPIPMEIVPGHIDGGTRRKKTMRDLWPVVDPLQSSENISISWADDQGTSFNTPRTVDASNVNARLNKMGSFRQRKFKIQFTGTQQVRIESLEGNLVSKFQRVRNAT